MTPLGPGWIVTKEQEEVIVMVSGYSAPSGFTPGEVRLISEAEYNRITGRTQDRTEFKPSTIFRVTRLPQHGKFRHVLKRMRSRFTLEHLQFSLSKAAGLHEIVLKSSKTLDRIAAQWARWMIKRQFIEVER